MSMRIPLMLICPEDHEGKKDETKKDEILKFLHVQGEYTFHELSRHKKYKTALPDKSVDCFIYNKREGYIDVPFAYGKYFYKNNFNLLCNKVQTKVKFTGQLREYQESFISEARDCLKEHDSVLLQARPGFGKTLCATLLSTDFGFITIIVVNRIPLLKQWKNTILKYTDGKVWVSGEKIPTEKVEFIVVMVDALNKIDPDYLKKIGTLIIDEAHMLATPTQIPAILNIKPIKIILCTATPDKDKRTTTILNLLSGKSEIQEKLLSNRVVRRYDGYLKVIKYYTNVEVEVKMQKDGRTPIWNSLVSDLNKHEGRNQLVVEWVKKNTDRKIIIMTWGQNHAPGLCNLIRDEGITVDHMSGNKQSCKDGQVLVGTFAKIGAGFDPSSNEDWDEIHYDLLIMVGTTRSLSLIEQLWGRAFRSSKPHIVVFIDNHKQCENHFKEMKKIAKLYQAEKLELRNIIKI